MIYNNRFIYLIFLLLFCKCVKNKDSIDKIVVWSFKYEKDNYCELIGFDSTIIIYDDTYYGIITNKIINTDSESLKFIRVLNTTNDTAIINSEYKKFLFKNFKTNPNNHSYKKVSTYILDNKTTINHIYNYFVDSVIIRANIYKHKENRQDVPIIFHQDDKDTLW